MTHRLRNTALSVANKSKEHLWREVCDDAAVKQLMLTRSIHKNVFVFQGRRNYIIMALAYSFTIAGAVMAGLSKAWSNLKLLIALTFLHPYSMSIPMHFCFVPLSFPSLTFYPECLPGCPQSATCALLCSKTCCYALGSVFSWLLQCCCPRNFALNVVCAWTRGTRRQRKSFYNSYAPLAIWECCEIRAFIFSVFDEVSRSWIFVSSLSALL